MRDETRRPQKPAQEIRLVLDVSPELLKLLSQRMSQSAQIDALGKQVEAITKKLAASEGKLEGAIDEAPK